MIGKSDLSNKIKLDFFQAEFVSVLLYECTTWTLTKSKKKKLDGKCIRILRAVLNKSWKQHPTKQQLYGYLPPISQTIQVKWTRQIGHGWRSKEELIRSILLWIPTHIHSSVDWSAKQQLCGYLLPISQTI